MAVAECPLNIDVNVWALCDPMPDGAAKVLFGPDMGVKTYDAYLRSDPVQDFIDPLHPLYFGSICERMVRPDAAGHHRQVMGKNFIERQALILGELCDERSKVK